MQRPRRRDTAHRHVREHGRRSRSRRLLRAGRHHRALLGRQHLRRRRQWHVVEPRVASCARAPRRGWRAVGRDVGGDRAVQHVCRPERHDGAVLGEQRVRHRRRRHADRPGDRHAGHPSRRLAPHRRVIGHGRLPRLRRARRHHRALLGLQRLRRAGRRLEHGPNASGGRRHGGRRGPGRHHPGRRRLRIDVRPADQRPRLVLGPRRIAPRVREHRHATSRRGRPRPAAHRRRPDADARRRCLVRPTLRRRGGLRPALPDARRGGHPRPGTHAGHEDGRRRAARRTIDLVGRCIRRAGLPLRCWSESDGSVADYPPLPLGAGNVVTLGGDSYYGTCVLADTAMAWCGRDDARSGRSAAERRGGGGCREDGYARSGRWPSRPSTSEEGRRSSS